MPRLVPGPGGGTAGVRGGEVRAGGGLHGRLAASVRAGVRWVAARLWLAGIAEVLEVADFGAYPLAG
ncbi:MAG: hypothetical protein M3313_12185 [Actinomycetota bacterium]|nr:hypothetical protein [Actinomycetota bacterium]